MRIEPACLTCCFSHSAYWLPTRDNYFTRWPIPLVVCRTGKRQRKRKYGLTANGADNKENKKRRRPERASRDASRYMPKFYTCRSRSVSRLYRISSTRQLGEMVWLQRFYASVCDHNFPSLVASRFSWRCLAASTSSSLHAAINLRPPSVTVSIHTSASNAVASQSPAMPTARMSLCTQSVPSFSFPPRPLRTAP